MELDRKIERLEAFKGFLMVWRQPDAPARLRSKINQEKTWVRQEVIAAGCHRTMTISPPPAVGGIVVPRIDPFDMMFNPPWEVDLFAVVIDMVDATVGALKAPADTSAESPHQCPAEGAKKVTEEETLKKLKVALQVPSLKTGFPSQDACLKWAGEVAPLLRFDKSYYDTFSHHLERLHLDLSIDAQAASLRVMITQVRMAAADLEAAHDETGAQKVKAAYAEGTYVDPGRVVELEDLSPKGFDLTKLVQLLRELDSSFREGNTFATGMLVRAILDHVPPIFGKKSFAEVANSYAGGKSFGESMKKLDQSSRNIADRYLHTQAREKEALPTPVQVDFTQDLDVLLEEIVRTLK